MEKKADFAPRDRPAGSFSAAEQRFQDNLPDMALAGWNLEPRLYRHREVRQA